MLGITSGPSVVCLSLNPHGPCWRHYHSHFTDEDTEALPHRLRLAEIALISVQVHSVNEPRGLSQDQPEADSSFIQKSVREPLPHAVCEGPSHSVKTETQRRYYQLPCGGQWGPSPPGFATDPSVTLAKGSPFRDLSFPTCSQLDAVGSSSLRMSLVHPAALLAGHVLSLAQGGARRPAPPEARLDHPWLMSWSGGECSLRVPGRLRPHAQRQRWSKVAFESLRACARLSEESGGSFHAL